MNLATTENERDRLNYLFELHKDAKKLTLWQLGLAEAKLAEAKKTYFFWKEQTEAMGHGSISLKQYLEINFWDKLQNE